MNPGNSRRRCRAIASVLAMALAATAHSAEPVAATLGLSAWVEKAWQRHPQAAGMGAREAQARAAQEAASSLTPEPASVSIANVNDAWGRNSGRQEWELELAVALWLPGQKEARAVEADRGLSEALARREAAKLEVAGEVREAWWSLATARAAESLALRRLDTARALLGEVRKRFKAGELSRVDANLAQGEVLAGEAQWVEAQTSLLQAEQAFELLTDAVAPIALREETRLTGPAPAEPAPTAGAHPQLTLAAAVAGTAHARLRVADESRRAPPELALRFVRERGDSAEPYGNRMGVRLKIPLSSGAQVRREASAALAESEQADAAMRRTEMRVRQEIDRAQRALDSAQRQWVMAREQQALFADNLRLAEKSFALGESDLTALLRSRAAAFEAESFHDRQRLARAAAVSRLNQSLGVLP